MFVIRLDVKRKFAKKIFSLALAGVLVISYAIPILAKTTTGSYSGFILTCTNTVSSINGKGSTSGAAKPYYNHVIVNTYDKNGKLKKSGFSRAKGVKTSKTVTSTGIHKCYTLHSALDTDFSHLESFNRQIKVTTTR